MTSISVIVPTFNRAAFLAEALVSISRQSRPVSEIIVWDDGSTDGTAQVIRDVGFDVSYYRAENGGKSRALNRALVEASGDYIWICDDDDIVLPHAAETLAGMLDRDPKLGVAGASYLRFTETAGVVSKQGPGYWPDLSAGSPIRHLLEDIFLFQNATIVRRETLKLAGPFREDLARSIDYDMIIRLGLLAPIEVTEDPVFLQRKHDGDRGPAAARHAAGQSDIVWKSTDKEVFAYFREKIPLAFYETMFDSVDERLVRRAALLQRACVYSRRTDWDTALIDLRAAIEVAPDLQLTDLERQICRRALAGKHGVDDILVPRTRVGLCALARSGRAGADICRALSRGLIWRVREAAGLRFFGKTASLGALALLLSRPVVSRRSTDKPAHLVERKTLPRSIYLELGGKTLP